jgi:ParB family chromosome partitioning protein
MHLSRINIQHIDFADDSYALTPPCCGAEIPAALAESIGRCGILHPPIVKEKAASSFAVVSGRKRLLAAMRVMPAASYDCHKVTDRTADIDTLALALEDTLLARSLTPVERAVFFSKALRLIDEKEAADRFLPLLGLAASTYLIRRELKLLELEEPLLIALHEGALDEKVAFELTKLPFSDRVALFEVISALHLSVGNQKKLAVTCRELAERHKTTIAALLRAPAVDAVINHAEANVPQKTANLMKWLTAERFPRLSRAEQEFQQFIAELDLPAAARLEHSPAFEKDELVFTLSCPGRTDFLQIWQKIRDLVPATGKDGPAETEDEPRSSQSPQR